MKVSSTLVVVVVAAVGCGGGEVTGPASVIDAAAASADAGVGADASEGDAGVALDAMIDQWDQQLNDRDLDYGAALRSASLKLTGKLPTLAQITTLALAVDARATYESMVQGFLDSPDFARQMFYWWQDTLKLGGTPELDSAAAFAAQLAAENRSYLELFTATAGQCGSFDETSATFTAGNCNNGVATHAGLLTHPGVNRQFYSNFAFRRVKWVQETFVCTKFPAESGPGLEIVPGRSYRGLFPFETMATNQAGGGGRVDFRDVSSVVCANCHSTLNHVAPLFAHFDDSGMYQSTMAVRTPLEGAPLAEPTDYLTLADGQDITELTAWRYLEPAASLPALGQAMAADPDVAACAIARLWNWALGKGDIVDTMREVPPEVIAQQLDDFIADGYQLKDAIFNVFTSDDFVRF
jgi:hypothetical protein